MPSSPDLKDFPIIHQDMDIGDAIRKAMDIIESSDESYYPYTHSVVIRDSGGFNLIYSDRGNLYSVGVSVSGMSVELDSEPQEVMIQFAPIEESQSITRQSHDKTGFSVFRDHTGSLKWSSIAACSVLNRSGELDSREFFDTLEESFDSSESIPLQLHHMGEFTRFGHVEGVFRLGNLLFAYGDIDESSTLGQHAERNLAQSDSDDAWGLSIGFWAEDWEVQELVTQDGHAIYVRVFKQGRLMEISVLREKRAANYFTQIVPITEVNQAMGKSRTEAKKIIEDWTGDSDSAEALLKQADETEEEIRTQGLITRETDTDADTDADVDVDTDVDTDVDADVDTGTDDSLLGDVEIELDEVLADEIEGMVKNAVTPYIEAIEKLTTQVNTLMESFRATSSAIEQLKKSEQHRFDESVADMPTDQKRKLVIRYRPSQDGTPIEETEETETPTASDQARRMRERRLNQTQ